MALRVVMPAAVDPVSLAEAKAHLRVDHSDDDGLIVDLIKAATARAQAEVQRQFVTATMEWVLQGWPYSIRLPIAPVAAVDVTSVKYVDGLDVAQTLPATDYIVRPRGPSIEIVLKTGKTWPPLSTTPAAEPVVVRFNAGTTAADVPANVKAAIKLLLGHFYANREAVLVGAGAQAIELPLAARDLLMQEAWSW
jgi:uncharacterized phiE125 gp8 family phage protein